MGFWGSLGKGLLKIAPVAASFIPGIGPLAAMGIGAATGAIGKKVSGGSWKDALKSGALGAATGASGGLIGKLGSKFGGAGGFVKDAVSGVENKALGMSPSLLSKVFAGMSSLGGDGGGARSANPGYNSTGMGMSSIASMLQGGADMGSMYSPIRRYNPPMGSQDFQSPINPVAEQGSIAPTDYNQFIPRGGGRVAKMRFAQS